MGFKKKTITVIEGDIAYKIVSNGKYKVIVDKENLHLIDEFALSVPLIRGRVNGVMLVKNRKQELLHRKIMGLTKGDGLQVDHKDRLKNRIDKGEYEK